VTGPATAPLGAALTGGFKRGVDRLSRLLGWRRYLLIWLLDGTAISLSFYLSFLIRFDGHIPRTPDDYWQVFLGYLPLLLAVRLGFQTAVGIHRWSFRFSGLYEAVRVVITSLAGSASFVTLVYFLQRVGPPRSVLVLELLLTTTLLGLLRFSPRYAREWLITRSRARSGGRISALIVGAGSAGELLLRDLLRSKAHHYDVVGFVDDNAGKWRTTIGGRPVLGPVAALPELVRRRGIAELLFAIPNLPPSRVREVVASCADLKLQYKILPVSFSYLRDSVPAAMLQQLAPEDLLHRSPVGFDESEMQSLIAGRRVLVTGAGGSIGSEIGRQVACHGPQKLVLADINENELYLLYRQLQQEHPGTEFRAEVLDIRDQARLERLFQESRFQDVFHAAAHKHVPLMEEAPEEAIKNNVSGCRFVAEAAHRSGVERFVNISTDKAVDPTSVMGASKRLAELLVRDLAARSSTRLTSVRFGNVLGSAGSVVPLFKTQIARGGPVTVTDAACRRYLMTISEAVGLVILAGLGGEGDLNILEMGEPIQILDLARLMITLSGHVPDQDVEIVFTGLRPGERLDERLMTDDEEQASRSLRHKIRAVATSPPGAEALRAIAQLEAVALQGDRHQVVGAIRAALPNYTPSDRWRETKASPSRAAS